MPLVQVREYSTAAAASRALADACLAIRWADQPAAVQDRTRELLLDLLGVALGGSRQPSSPPAARVAAALAGEAEPRASVFGAGFATSAVWAALANGTAAHALELDDVTTESSLHPGVAVIPAAFALAEALGSPPAAFFEAVVAGYEVTMRVGAALGPASAYARGFHPTGVAGVFGAAMAAGRLLDLDASRLARAVGIAGTLASGSLEYLSDGAWTKRLNPGWAGHAGITAAYLAREGFTGPATALEGRLGLLHAYSDGPAPERLLANLGQGPLQVMRASIKPYACCRYNHGLIDCVLQLSREYRVQPEQVERIRLGVLTGGRVLVADPIEHKRQPQSVVDAQFSAPYAAAAALVLGTGGLDAYAPEHLEDPRIQQLMQRTDCYSDPGLDAGYPALWPAAAEIALRDGQTLRTRIEYMTGEPENPVPRAALIDKFVALASGVVSDPVALAARILQIDSGEADLRGLGAALRA